MESKQTKSIDQIIQSQQPDFFTITFDSVNCPKMTESVGHVFEKYIMVGMVWDSRDNTVMLDFQHRHRTRKPKKQKGLSDMIAEGLED